MSDANLTTERLDAPTCAVRSFVRALSTIGVALVAVGVVGCAAKAWDWSVLPAAFLGLLLAALAVGGGVVFHDRARRTHRFDSDARLASQRLQAMLAASFLCKLIALVVGFGCLMAWGVKFPGQVAFGLAFAVAALSLQLGTALRLTSRTGGAAPTASTTSR